MIHSPALSNLIWYQNQVHESTSYTLHTYHIFGYSLAIFGDRFITKDRHIEILQTVLNQHKDTYVKYQLSKITHGLKYLRIYYKPSTIFKMKHFLHVHWFKIFCNISAACLCFIMHLPKRRPRVVETCSRHTVLITNFLTFTCIGGFWYHI